MSISEIKELIRRITKHFDYDEYIINILTICYIAIVSIDSEVSDILEEVLSTKYILENDGSFIKMLKTHYPDIEINLDTYYEPTFDSEICNKDDFIIISIFQHNDMCETIEAFIHELKHAMNSIIKRYESGKCPVFRCGLCQVELSENKPKFYRYILMEEAFNSFLTKIYMRQVLKLRKVRTEDSGIRKILKSFKMEGYEYSYNKITTLLEPLFCDEELFKLFYNAALYKDYTALYRKLESIFNEDIDTIDMSIEDYFYNADDELKECIESSYPSRRLKIRIPDTIKTISN